MKILQSLVVSLGLVLPALCEVALPLKTSSRWILDANDERVKFRCINWAGHMEVNLPEGLNHNSIESVADQIAQHGFNCVRLTYSIDLALDPNQKARNAFSKAANDANVSADGMQKLYEDAKTNNELLANATNIDVFGAVIDALWARGVMTILDNHVSKASWCCNLEDGNGWWDDAFGYVDANSRYFKTQDWLDGLTAMATWAKAHEGVVGMSLRNELRELLLQNLNGRDDWYEHVAEGAKAVHGANGDVLVLVGGSASSTDLSHVRTRSLDTSAWAGKHVWEWHAYSFTVTFPDLFGSCDFVRQEYGLFDGFLLEQGKDYTGPLILSEFGAGLTGGSADKKGLSDEDHSYLGCLVGYMEANDADWALWAVQGSYYIRSGEIDQDESWGFLNHNWSNVRNADFKGLLGKMFDVTQKPGS